MRRRITLAFVAVLAISLALAGGISFYFVRREAGESTKIQLLNQVKALARSTKDPNLYPLSKKDPEDLYTTLIPFLKAITTNKVQVYTFVVGVHDGNVTSVSSLPGVTKSSISTKPLVEDRSESGLVGSLAFAMAPLFSVKIGTRTSIVGIALENPVSFGGENTWYFLVAGGVSLLVTGALTAVISRRIARHTITAADAAQQIADGDFATRINITGNEYPELAQLGTSLNTMAENLERSRDLSRQFLLSISHDLRTPLTSIRGYAEAIAEGVTEDLPQAASVVVSEADRLGRLIGDLLDLARIEARQFSLHVISLDAVVMAAAAIDALRYEFDASNISINLEAPKEPLIMEGDPDRLRQVVANLVENALRFARTKVTLCLEATASEVHIAVEDDGLGIPAEDLPRVFERHFTSGRGKSRSSGTGLGLAIVFELVEAMQGRTEVVSPLTPDGGTRFTMYFPKAGVTS